MPGLRRLTVNMVHESHFVSQFFQEMLRHHPFGNFSCQRHTVLLRWNSSSLTVVFVTMQKRLRFPQHNSTACALAGHGLSCSVAVCVHVHRLRECNDFDQALCTRDTFQVSCDALHVHLDGLSGTKDLSCCFLHAVHDVSTLLAHVQQLSHSCPAHGSFLVLQLDQ